MTDDTLKIDRPIRGSVELGYTNRVEQFTAQQFLTEIDNALTIPGVKGLIWEQFVPYFNDGEPCEFSIGEVRVLVDGLDQPDDWGEYEFERGLSVYDTYGGSVHPGWGDLDAVNWKTFGEVDGRVLYDLLHSLNSNRWENVARANFGDHAQVIATKDGFEVEFYEHD